MSRVELEEAVNSGDVERVLMILNSTRITDEHRAVFSWVCETADAAMVQLFLDSNLFDVNNVPPSFPDTLPPLSSAILGRQSRRVIEMLLRHPLVDINQLSAEEWTPLTVAAAVGDEETCRALLQERDIDINHNTRCGTNAIKLALEKGFERILELLLAHPLSDPDLEACMGSAIENNLPRVVEVLLKDPRLCFYPPPVEECGPFGSMIRQRTPFLLRCRGEEHEEIFNLLMTHKDLDLRKESTEEEGSPLYFAAATGSEAQVKALLARLDLDVNHKRRWGSTALHMAVMTNRTKIVSELLKHPLINLNSESEYRNFEGATPLFMAAKEGSLESVRLLLADPRTLVNKGQRFDHRRPLDVAMSLGHEEIVKEILCHPLLQLYPDRKEDFPLDEAYFELSQELIDRIVSHPQFDLGFERGSMRHVYALHRIIRENKHEILDLLIRLHLFDANQIAHSGSTALMIAVEKNSLSCVESLLRIPDININIKHAKTNETALNLSRKLGFHEITRLLSSDPRLVIDIEDIRAELYKALS